MKIAIGNDTKGYHLKLHLVKKLRERSYEVDDLGCDGVYPPVDYPDYAKAVCDGVVSGKYERGILICGTGIGMSIAANKLPGIRAALCYDLATASNAREHNYANVLTLGAGFLGTALALQIVETWLATDWGAERHGRRVEKISAIERSYTGAPGGKDR